jgi:hypothetical protein
MPVAHFKADHPVASEKIRKDTNLAEIHRDSFWQHIQNCPPGTPVDDHADAFFNKNKLLGPAVAIDPEEKLNRLTPIDAFVAAIYSHASARNMGLSKDYIEKSLKMLRGMASDDQIEALRDAYGSFPIARFIMWSFRYQKASHPSADHSFEDLRCRLALGPQPGPYILLTFTLPSGCVPHVPTAFDPGLKHLARWEAGGKTRPEPACAGKFPDGLEETVHQAILYQQVEALAVD